MTDRQPGKTGRVWRWPLRSGLVTTLALLGTQQTLMSACGLSVSDIKPPPPAPGSGNGGSPSGTGGSTSGWQINVSDASVGGSGCQFDAGADASVDASTAFADEAFSWSQLWPLVIFSWTTADQVAELRSNSVLFSHSERAGLGRGTVFDQLAVYAANRSGNDSALAKLLGEQLFKTARFGWTNPWATRMGWPGEQYGDQLLRIELRPEAWIVYFDGNSLSVSGADHQSISIDQALATPERIGAIYFENSAGPAASSCVGTFGLLGGGGFREFVLGNIAMVKQWSLATADIQQKIESDIAKLQALRSLLEACPPAPYFDQWNAEVVCSWHYVRYGSTDGYFQSLALPSEYYYPTADAITTLIDTLESDPFTLDPFVVDVSPQQ